MDTPCGVALLPGLCGFIWMYGHRYVVHDSGLGICMLFDDMVSGYIVGGLELDPVAVFVQYPPDAFPALPAVMSGAHYVSFRAHASVRPNLGANAATLCW